MTNEELREALEKTSDDGGRITPAGVVAAAADPDNPLHADPGFYWGDDAGAAHQHRLEHARTLIRRVPVYNRIEHRGEVRVPCYIRDPQAGRNEQGYVALSSVQRASADARRVVAGELDRVVGALKRAAAVTGALELPGLEQQLENVLAAAAELQGRLYRRDAA